MRARLLIDTIKAWYRVKRTICIVGAPGGGKTSLVKTAAEELKVEYREVIMANKLVEDFGVQYPDGDILRYKIPDWFPREPDSEGILCFDDRNQANSDLQKVFANLCQARNLHGTPLPRGWMVVSTGNRKSDRAGANHILTHLSNRETVYELDTNVDDWTVWATKNNVHPSVIGFIRFKADLLHDFDPTRDANPTPRSWVEGVSAAIGVVPQSAEHESFIGAIGKGAASDFTSFIKIYRELPDIDELLRKPAEAPVHKEPIIRYAITTAVAARITEKNIDNALEYLNRLPAEFGVLGVSLATARDITLCNTKAFATWGAKNADVLF